MTLNAYELQDMLKDYNKTFPDWREDDGKKTPKNPIGLNSKFGYWGSGSYD
jgi:hypothetical protein